MKKLTKKVALSVALDALTLVADQMTPNADFKAFCFCQSVGHKSNWTRSKRETIKMMLTYPRFIKA